MHIFLLKALKQFNSGQSDGDSGEMQKGSSAILRELDYLKGGNQLHLLEDAIHPNLLFLAKAVKNGPPAPGEA